MDLLLGPLAALVEDLGSVLSTHMECVTSNSRKCNALFWTPQEPGMYVVRMHTCRLALIHIK